MKAVMLVIGTETLTFPDGTEVDVTTKIVSEITATRPLPGDPIGTVYPFVSPGPFVFTPNFTGTIKAECFGAGQAGNNSIGTFGGSGGRGGAFASSFVSVVAGLPYNLTVGAGGDPAGLTSGGDTSFGSEVVAKGGGALSGSNVGTTTFAGGNSGSGGSNFGGGGGAGANPFGTGANGGSYVGGVGANGGGSGGNGSGSLSGLGAAGQTPGGGGGGGGPLISGQPPAGFHGGNGKLVITRVG